MTVLNVPDNYSHSFILMIPKDQGFTGSVVEPVFNYYFWEPDHYDVDNNGTDNDHTDNIRIYKYNLTDTQDDLTFNFYAFLDMVDGQTKWDFYFSSSEDLIVFKLKWL